MDGLTFHERLNILLHNRGDEYVIPNPFWKPEDLTRNARAAMDTLYTSLIEFSRASGKPVECLNQMVKSTTATVGTNVPDDFYDIIIGRKADGSYVNADPMPIAAASSGYDSVWTSAGKFRGTAATAYYYARPTGPCDPSDPDTTTFPDGFYDTVISLTAIQMVMSEEQDGADRLDVLYELFQGQMSSLAPGLSESAARSVAKFSKQIQTTKRKWLTELRESDASLGGWNPDATTSDRPMGDFEEVFNMRKMKPGELETRTGYKRWILERKPIEFFPERITNPPGTPLWKAEYRLDNTFVDVTFYIDLIPGGSPSNMHDWKVFAYVLHPENTDNRPDSDQSQIVEIASCGMNPVVCAYQYQTYLVISITAPDLASTQEDAQMYAMWPSNPPTISTSGLTDWNVQTLGKQVSPTPTGVTFAPKIQGPLFVTPSLSYDVNDPHFNPQIDPITGLPASVALQQVVADYFLSGSNLAPVEPLWVVNKTDIPVTEPVDSAMHVQSRGCWYRTVLKRQVSDARGQKHIISEAPSSDFYVPERMYGPAGIGVLVNSVLETVDDIDLSIVWTNNPLNKWRDDGNTDHDIGGANGFPVGNRLGTGNTSATAFPTNEDYFNLRKKIRAQFPALNDGDALLFLTAIFGWYGQSPVKTGFFFPNGVSPYLLSARSHQVNGAPNAQFTWSDFIDPDTGAPCDPTIPGSTLYAIDFYRTAYSYPDEKDNATKSPLWGTAYNYGYATTLHASDVSVLDNIADTALLFDQSPVTADGYLVGQFAGQVMRPYQDHLVLGNTREKNRLRNPWSGIQAFQFPVASGGYAAADFVPAPDGLPKNDFYYLYQDRDGNTSDAVRITVRPLDTPSASANVAFLFPRGYSDTVTSAVLYRSIWEGGQRNFYRETVVLLANGVYTSTNAALTGPVFGIDAAGIIVASSDPTKWPVGGVGLLKGIATFHNTETSIDPGYIIWSKKNNPWEWPQENILNVHDQNPINGIDEVLGPLYLWSDRGVSMTRTDNSGNEFGYLEPVHTSSTGVGCISRFAIVKVDQVVFHLGAGGLFYTGGSGVVAFPADIQTEIVKRLRELIPDYPMLAGLREQVSMSWNSNRAELMISFPSTINGHDGFVGGGILPARTFVIKFVDESKEAYTGSLGRVVNKMYCYEFELAHEPLEMEMTPTGRIIYLPHADGSLFCAYFLPGGTKADLTVVSPKLVVEDVDRPELPWPGEWGFQYQHAMGTPNVSKRWFQFNFLAEAQCQLFLKSGVQREDGWAPGDAGTQPSPPQAGLPQRANGTLDPRSPIREVRTLNAGSLTEYRLPISGSVFETSGTPPGIRLCGQPLPDTGENHFKIESFDLYFGFLHQHKG